MKKILSYLLTVVMMATLLAGCAAEKGKDNGDTGTPSVDSAETNKADSGSPKGFDKDPSDIGVVLVINTNLGDKSFCDLSYAGMMKAAEEFGFRTKVVELNGDATLLVPTYTEFAEDPDWDIIVGGTYNSLEHMQQVAEEFPDQKFILYDAKDNLNLPNIYCVETLQNEGSFLAGAAAALLTKNKPLANDQDLIGFVAGSENTSINDFLVGYIQGAQEVNPDCKVLISYIGDFKDSAKAKELALGQISQGADVVFQVAAAAGLGVLDACKESDVYAIGVDADQSTVLEDSDPVLAQHIATSMMKNIDTILYNALKSAVEGTLPWGSYEQSGIKQATVGLAKNKVFDEIFTEEDKKLLSELEEKVASGEIEVKTAVGMDNDALNKLKSSATP